MVNLASTGENANLVKVGSNSLPKSEFASRSLSLKYTITKFFMSQYVSIFQLNPMRLSENILRIAKELHLLGKELQARLNLASGPVDAEARPNLTYGAKRPTRAMSTTIPTSRSAAYNSNSFQKSFPLFCTSAKVAQHESMTT